MFPIAANRSDEEGQLYVDDVFSTYLYTGNGGTQTINNGINLLKTDAWKMLSITQYSNVPSYPNFDVDASGNFYFGLASYAAYTSSPQASGIVKLDSSGTVLWQKSTFDGYGTDSIIVDSNGNSYILGVYLDTSNRGQYLLMKYDPSGTLLWTKSLLNGSLSTGILQKDSSNNIYVSCNGGTGGRYAWVSKFDPSGNMTWSVGFTNPTAAAGAPVQGFYIDGSDNLFITSSAYDYTGGLEYVGFLLKLNTSGTIIWQSNVRRSNGGSFNSVTGPSNIAKDSDGNIYVLFNGATNGGGGYDSPIVCKWNASGTFVTSWRIYYPNLTSYNSSARIAIDSSNNIFVTNDIVGTYSAYLYCFNTSGTLQWKKQITTQAGRETRSLKISSSNKLLIGLSIAFNSGSNYASAVVEVPSTGILSGSLPVIGGSSLVASDISETVQIVTTNIQTASFASISHNSSITASSFTPTPRNDLAWGGQVSSQSQQSNDGMVWIKSRSGAADHQIVDTVRGATYNLVSNTTGAQGQYTTGLTSFNADGFSISTNTQYNLASTTYASWTFRKAAKFFDVVTYTGDGVAGRTIAHSLGVAPGMVIVKSLTNSGSSWRVWHNSFAATDMIRLNSTAAKDAGGATAWNSTAPSATEFTLGTFTQTNASGESFVAYLFAHDPSANGIIQCGSFTGGSWPLDVNLGWEPQYVMVKSASSESTWWMFDSMRGLSDADANAFRAEASAAEQAIGGNYIGITSTGFKLKTSAGGLGLGTTNIYMAIRRPNKPPTSGTQVFMPLTQQPSSYGTFLNTGFAQDLVITGKREGSGMPQYVEDKLRGVNTTLNDSNTYPYLSTAYTDAEVGQGWGLTQYWKNNGFYQRALLGTWLVSWCFKRAPGFMDVVCYNSTQANASISHNLTVVPELILVKCRSNAFGWFIYSAPTGNASYLSLESTASASPAAFWQNTTPTTTQFFLNSANAVNGTAGQTYVAYLFATLAGVSKVGSYTGNGGTQNIDCGFAAGARFVMIKRTDIGGNWYVWDSARGINFGNDTFLLMNSGVPDYSNWDTIDPYSPGFTVKQVSATNNINATNGSYIFLAIS